MSCTIKKVSADLSADLYYNATPTPKVWTAVYADRTTYASAYLALSDAVSIRDGLSGLPSVQSTDKVVVLDTTSGAEYATPTLASLL